MDGVRIDPSALAADLAELVRIPSVTGQERAALSWVCRRAEELGLEAELTEHDLAALRGHPEHPGEEASRDALFGVVAEAPGVSAETPRLCLNGHLDVVDPGSGPWALGPWSGAVRTIGRPSVMLTPSSKCSVLIGISA